MSHPTKRWHWKWYWVPYEPHWLIIPSIIWFGYPAYRRDKQDQGRDIYEWSLGIQWGKWYIGFGAHVYPKV